MLKEMSKNRGCELDLGWLCSTVVNAWCVYDAVEDIPLERKRLNGIYKAAWLLRGISCIDLTTLSGDDTRSNVVRLSNKAARPVKVSLLQKLGFPTDKPFMTAAVCVYPARVLDVVQAIKGTAAECELNIAAVATGFPSGQYELTSRLEEIHYAVRQGATEIDIVIDRSLVLTGRWDLLYEELKKMKEACGKSAMKTILAVGELATLQNVYKASLVAMMAGTDFIKTSTGKEAVNATLQVGLVMMRAIREYFLTKGFKVGFKAAGGIRTADDVLNWLILVKRELGKEWLNKKLFRIGASGLLADIEKNLYFLAYNEYPTDYEFTLG